VHRTYVRQARIKTNEGTTGGRQILDLTV